MTYQAVEAAFSGIPNVEILHFNAVAGLDRFKDVTCLIVIGRPLPSLIELEALAGGYFGATGGSGYTTERRGVRMVSGEVLVSGSSGIGTRRPRSSVLPSVTMNWSRPSGGDVA